MAKATGTAKRKPSIEMSVFVTAWQGSGSVQEVSEKTGLAKGSVQTRASKYRESGIPLKDMPRGGGKRLDIDAAKALIAELSNSTIESVEADSTALLAKRAERKAKREAKASS